MKKILVCLVTIICFFSIPVIQGFNIVKTYAASAETSGDALECTVTFDCDGGEYYEDKKWKPVFTKTVIAGSLVEKPDRTKLKRENCSFNDWYTSSGDKWNFENDIVENDLTLYASWLWDETADIMKWGEAFDSDEVKIEKYFSDKYQKSKNWRKVSSNSTLNVSGTEPLNIQRDPKFPESEILTAVKESVTKSKYGGCGPIAMIGILDYFARYRNYTSIMNNPENSADRIALAKEVFNATPTSEVSNFSVIDGNVVTTEQSNTIYEENDGENELLQILSSSGDKDKETFTWPNAFVDAFNSLVQDKYNLGKQIVAKKESLFSWNKINRIKQSIDAGFPVTVYCGLYGSSAFSDHYVNVYGYQDWEGVNKSGNAITNTVFKARLNWPKLNDEDYYDYSYMDAGMLSATISGVIYYTVKDNNQLIRPSDFAEKFVNETTKKGQYFFTEKSAVVTTAEGFSFNTNRLRCSYIEDTYLVLSANRENAGLAYLDMSFNFRVKAINLDISLWSSNERLGNGDYIKLFYMDDDQNWQEAKTFNIDKISKLKDTPDNVYIELPKSSFRIKLEVSESTPLGDRNKGRVVIGDMNLFY